VVEGLRRLEYRGYDSAGVSYVQGGALSVIRAEGKLANLEKRLERQNVFSATAGMGHTRWATHGPPVEKNAHPHTDHTGRLAIIHNGIIENYQEIKAELSAKGIAFRSDTDSEVLINLIAECLKDTAGDVTKAISKALSRVDGAYAIVVMSADHPGTLWATRVASPLVMGVGTGENFFGSDIPAFLPYTRDVVFLEDGELVKITASSWEVMETATLKPIEKKVAHINWDVQAAEKGGFKHFMLKEIFEQPKVIRDCLLGRIDAATSQVRLPELDKLPAPERLHIVACGTSYHAGLWGMYLLEKYAKIPVQVEIASEFRYREPILPKNSVVLAISQSGETMDTMAGIKLAKSRGLPVIGLCNVVGSSISREADYVVYSQAGPEISVASTKAMCSQLTALFAAHPLLGTPHRRHDRNRLRRHGARADQPAPGAGRRPAGAARHGPATGAPLLRGHELPVPGPRPKLPPGPGRRTQAQGNKLYPRRGLCRRRNEARSYRPHRPALPHLRHRP
jgi:glucosamine--fructose-6-phosphate aminotransferase (isomerizing)